ncbi:MAG: hypothetical protein KKE23_00220 [Nanoarchaeota archaeon]|nr:hypothetical protein [Nanoarchaeota archaeon]
MAKISNIFSALFLILLMAGTVSAFSISSDSQSASICIGSTKMLSSLVEGGGTFTVSQEGTASTFSTTVPNSFSTEGSQNIYSYITPSSKISPGDYTLRIKLSDGSEQKEHDYSITVKDCQKTEFSAESKKVTCPCQKTEFVLNIVNNADYSENFTLSAEGTLKGWIEFSEQSFRASSGEEKEIIAFVHAPCNINGQYDITFKLKPSRYFSSLSAKSEMDIQPCYDYSLNFENRVYFACENEQLIVPLTLSNEGSSDNSFSIDIDGPDWITYEKSADVDSGESNIINLIMNPPRDSAGNFTIKVNALSEYGNVNKKAETVMSVENCHELSMNFENDKETICNMDKEYSYLLSIRNSGKLHEDIDLSIEGPSWASLSEDSMFVERNESKEVYVDIKFPSDMEAGEYEIKVIASGATRSESTFIINTKYPEDCFSSDISSEKDSIEVSLEGASIIAIEVKNDGLEESTFIIGLDGDASLFSMINPEIITLSPEKSETIYVYISPPSFTELRDYDLSIYSRVKDTNLVSSEDIKITVVNERMSSEPVDEESQKGFFSKMFSKIGSFFRTVWTQTASIFSLNSQEESNVEDSNFENTGSENFSMETIVSEFENNVTGVSEEVEEEIIEDVIKVEEATIELNEADEIMLNETVETAETVEKVGFFSRIFGLGKTEVLNETITLEEVTIEDVEETSNAEEATEEIEDITENVEESGGVDSNITQFNLDNAKKSLLNFSAYKDYLIGMISLLILIIIFATGFWKKIIDFFDEDTVKKSPRKK